MSLFPLPNAKLECPRCRGSITTIHPHYTAAERSIDLNFYSQWERYLLAGLIGAIWWPLGIAAVAAVFFNDIRKAKHTKLSCCKACDVQLSYAEAFTGEKTET